METEKIQVEEVIWLIDKESRPGDWKIGRISEVYPGKDGRIRVVRLRVDGKEMTRSVSQIFPLEYEREMVERK